MSTPLAEQLRPQNLDQVVGQQHLLAGQHPLARALKQRQLHSMILWGPSGVGKTTLARVMARHIEGDFIQLSAVLDGVKELRQVVEVAQQSEAMGRATICFIDEIHRFNKAQQDALLPHVESGLITLIGATTENPAFEINRALLSRLSVYILEALSSEELQVLVERACEHLQLELSAAAKARIAQAAGGDGRRALNIVEQLNNTPGVIDEQALSNFLQDKVASFDKGGDVFYQQLSAFHKSVRGSSPDGALYWMSRMIEGGSDPKVIARRLLAIASEDIGNADPRALQVTLNAWDIYHRVGDKEGIRAIAQAVTYCAVAPKSNALYLAHKAAMRQAKETHHLAVPKHLCNAPTKLDQEQGYGQGYRYAHDEVDGISYGQTYFPDELGEQSYYEPTDRGLEIKIREKLKHIKDKS